MHAIDSARSSIPQLRHFLAGLCRNCIAFALTDTHTHLHTHIHASGKEKGRKDEENETVTITIIRGKFVGDFKFSNGIWSEEKIARHFTKYFIFIFYRIFSILYFTFQLNFDRLATIALKCFATFASGSSLLNLVKVQFFAFCFWISNNFETSVFLVHFQRPFSWLEEIERFFKTLARGSTKINEDDTFNCSKTFLHKEKKKRKHRCAQSLHPPSPQCRQLKQYAEVRAR